MQFVAKITYHSDPDDREYRLIGPFYSKEVAQDWMDDHAKTNYFVGEILPLEKPPHGEKIAKPTVGQWVVNPFNENRGIISHVYHDNVTEDGILVEIDWGNQKTNHRHLTTVFLRLSKDQVSGWVDKPKET